MVYGVTLPETNHLYPEATCVCGYSVKSSFLVYLVGRGVRVVPMHARIDRSLPKCTIRTLGCSEMSIGIR